MGCEESRSSAVRGLAGSRREAVCAEELRPRRCAGAARWGPGRGCKSVHSGGLSPSSDATGPGMKAPALLEGGAKELGPALQARVRRRGGEGAGVGAL